MSVGELYLIRHGEASGADGSSPGLSERGRRQVESLGARLAGTSVAGIMHSPRRRAEETAVLISEVLPGIPVRSTTLLDDRTPVPSPDRRGEYPQHYWQWLDETAPDERDQDAAVVSEAVGQLAETARNAADAGPLLAVTHAFVIGWFVRAALDAPVFRWLGLNPANASLTKIRYLADEARLVAYNDIGHLS